MRQQRGLIVTSMLALFVEVGLRLLEPWPLKFVFDRIIHVKESNPHWNPAWVDSMDSMTLLTLAAISVVVLTGFRALASYSSTIGFAQLGNRVLMKVRNQLYRHVHFLSLSFHTKAKTGDLVVRMLNDIGMLQEVAVTALLPTLAKILIVTGMIALMFVLNWKLAICAICVLPIFWLRTMQLGKKIQAVAKKQRRQEGAMAATAAESFSAIRVVQALSLEKTFADAFSSESEKNSREDVKGKRLSAAMERTVDVLVAVATALVLWFGARLVLRGEISSGDLLVFLAYLKSAYRPVQDFAKYSSRMAKASAAGERVMDLLERVPDVRDLPHSVPAPAFRGIVKFENVNFGYEHGKALLQQINLEIQAGQHIALVGPSGGGKSTLVSLVLRLYDPVQGRLTIDGRDIREYTLESLRQQISVVLQDNVLFATTVRENIAYGSPNASLEQVEEAARLANAHDFIQALPQGYETILGERGATLSHGQRQRIAIARAAIRKAPILIFDEPTTGLDQKNERAVLEALERLYQNQTVFMITHNLQHATNADAIFYLEHGRVIERGTHEELIKRNGRYAASFRLQKLSNTSELAVPLAPPQNIIPIAS